jgi:hypothetical protein
MCVLRSNIVFSWCFGLRCLMRAVSGAHPSSTSICTDCCFHYVPKFSVNLKIPKLVLSSDGPQTLLAQVCKQQHFFLCAVRLWMTLSLIEWGRQKSVASETPINFCEEFWLSHPWRQCRSYSSPWECHILHSCWVVCVFRVCLYC